MLAAELLAERVAARDYCSVDSALPGSMEAVDAGHQGSGTDPLPLSDSAAAGAATGQAGWPTELPEVPFLIRHA